MRMRMRLTMMITMMMTMMMTMTITITMTMTMTMTGRSLPTYLHLQGPPLAGLEGPFGSMTKIPENSFTWGAKKSLIVRCFNI